MGRSKQEVTTVSGFIVEQVAIVPAGEYPARVTVVREYVFRGKLEHWREVYLRWEFQIEGGPYDGRPLAGWTRTRFARGSRLFAWVQAALGQKIAPDYTLNTADLTGRRVRVQVQVVPDENTGELRNPVTEVLPWPAGQGGG